MNLKQAYSYSMQFLEGNHVDEADFKALCVACHVAGIKNSEYAAHINDEIIMSRLAKLLWRVKCGEPLQYVLGKWDFYESEFYVGEGVLIPRPETEELVDLTLKYAKRLNNPVIVDLCSGSGCIGLSIAQKLRHSTVYCIEKSAEAFAYLQKNANGVDNAVLIKEDISRQIDIPLADIIISNPPYIKSSDLAALQQEVHYEPQMALDGGADGLDFYRIINAKWADKLKNNGLLFLEIGEEQGDSIQEVLTNFREIKILKDIYGNDRMVQAVKG